MKPNDFIYNQIFKSSLKAGACSSSAQKFSVIGVNSYMKNSFKGTASKLIEDMIKSAVAESKLTKSKPRK